MTGASGWIHATALAISIALSGSAILAEAMDCRPDRVLIFAPEATGTPPETPAPITITVEIADTPASRARGLMGRESLAPGTGMLFVYDHPQPVAFWMHNTLIPLDMVFVDARGVIRHIHAGAIPHDETPIPGNLHGDPDPDRLLVLEIGGGEAAASGITEGMILAHPALPAQGTASACR